MSKYYQYVKRSDSVQTDSQLWKNLLPELAYFPDAVEDITFKQDRFITAYENQFFLFQEYEFYGEEKTDESKTTYTDETIQEKFTIIVKSPVLIESGDPKHLAVFYFLETLYANIEIENERLTRTASQLKITSTSGGSFKVNADVKFSVSFTAENYISNLKIMFSDYVHVISFLESLFKIYPSALLWLIFPHPALHFLSIFA
jgi:hypothetical protein